MAMSMSAVIETVLSSMLLWNIQLVSPLLSVSSAASLSLWEWLHAGQDEKSEVEVVRSCEEESYFDNIFFEPRVYWKQSLYPIKVELPTIGLKYAISVYKESTGPKRRRKVLLPNDIRNLASLWQH
ncbi:hypothetical protein H5410_037130 [Solanum commersonii]|uniref:Uncharacterized protein n=1 Tax=Solanum commersonii TaxID=4109 RepID=A0A9J5Y756_SOLCO|nr:hypothetical protein H5410_037130 [Solanum commersonii]